MTLTDLFKAYHLQARIQYEAYGVPVGSTNGYTIFDVTLFPAPDSGVTAPCDLSFFILANAAGGPKGAALFRCPDQGLDAGISYDMNVPATASEWRRFALDVVLDADTATVTIDVGAGVPAMQAAPSLPSSAILVEAARRRSKEDLL